MPEPEQLCLWGPIGRFIDRTIERLIESDSSTDSSADSSKATHRPTHRPIDRSSMLDGIGFVGDIGRVVLNDRDDDCGVGSEALAWGVGRDLNIVQAHPPPSVHPKPQAVTRLFSPFAAVALHTPSRPVPPMDRRLPEGQPKFIGGRVTSDFLGRPVATGPGGTAPIFSFYTRPPQ